MATVRLSGLQKKILRWLAHDWKRSRGQTASSHQELVRALRSDKGNVSHSLHTLEARGFVVIGRSTGRKAEYITLTAEGKKQAAQVAGSCD